MNDHNAPRSAHVSPSRGVVYIAFGDAYIAEAVHSALSLRQHCPDLSSVPFTDTKAEHPIFSEQRIVPIDHIRAKVDLLAETPFEHTLYLDSDTQIVSDIRDVFGLFDRVDVALTQDFARRRPSIAPNIPEYAAIPYGFPEMNGGLILYRRCAAVQDFLRTWRDKFYLYREQTRGWDQPSFADGTLAKRRDHAHAAHRIQRAQCRRSSESREGTPPWTGARCDGTAHSTLAWIA